MMGSGGFGMGGKHMHQGHGFDHMGGGGHFAGGAGGIAGGVIGGGAIGGISRRMRHRKGEHLSFVFNHHCIGHHNFKSTSPFTNTIV